ncbi:hypothetical protein, partial [Enterobacter kobei]|uniref:hypothetical protein n=1 Tax=Enterobacter kobei TaxID=208224 RepID=UPI0039C9FB40
SAQIREILISESAWEEMTCLFAPSLGKVNGKNSFGAYAGAAPFAVTLVVESQLLPIIDPKYKLGSKVIVNDDASAIRYMAISKLCNE